MKFSLLSKLLSQVRSLSIVTHMMLIPIKIPATVMIFYSEIFGIVSFDLFGGPLKFDDLLQWVFGFDDQPIPSDDNRYDELGYGSHYIVTNLSSVFVFFIVDLVIQLMFLLIIQCKCCHNKIITVSSEMHGRFKWNGAISSFNEVYLLLSFCVAINLHGAYEGLPFKEWIQLQFASGALTFNSLFALFSFLSLLIVPVLLIVVLNKYWYPHLEEANRWRHK